MGLLESTSHGIAFALLEFDPQQGVQIAEVALVFPFSFLRQRANWLPIPGRRSCLQACWLVLVRKVGRASSHRAAPTGSSWS